MKLRHALPIAPFLLALLAPLAAAQEVSTFPVERFRPAMNREGLLDVEWGAVGEPFSFDVALWFGYAHEPLVLYESMGDQRVKSGTIVAHRLGANLVGAVVVHSRIELGLDLPLILYQSAGDGVPPGSITTTELATAGVGDLRFAPKAQLLVSEDHFFDLAILASISFPTASASDSYFGDDGISMIPELVVSRAFNGFQLALNLGYRWRPEARLLDLDVGPELLYRLGVGYDFDHHDELPFELALTANGATSTDDFFGDANENPLELLFGVAYQPVDPWTATVGTGTGLISGFGSPVYRFFAGVAYSHRRYDRDGDGYSDDEDGCPDDPEDFDEFEDHDGCPDVDNDQDGLLDPQDQCPVDPEDFDAFEDDDGCPDPDNDGDGVLDVNDACPDDPEDIDLFQDEDGCPEPDNDIDGFLDWEDMCPIDPEDLDGYEDDNGCPDPDNDGDGFLDVDDACPIDPEDFDGDADGDGCPEEFTEVTDTQIEIWDKVHFETDSDVILPESFGLLDEVARIIRSNDTMRVRVEGHTDDHGRDAYNLELSDNRAASVRQYLVEAGVQPEQLEAVGYGETQPIESNNSRRGRAMNRRVEFHIVER